MSEPAGRRIVIVDDDESALKLLERQLTGAGYQVRAFTSGRASVEAICELGLGIVITDWNMPEMNGLQLCAAIRELEEMNAVQHIYVLMLTCRTDKADVVAGLAAGASDYLTKPYHVGELLARIDVGERMLKLHRELMRKNVEVQKANAQMALLAHRLEQQAKSDALTGLANRRYIFERLEEHWSLCARDGRPLSVIMLDVDRFKSVNDTHGHQAGDAVLKAVAKVIRSSGRRPDLCGRFGGEEFVVLCPATPAVGADVLAERIRTRIAGEIVHCDSKLLRVTVSCGVAERCPETESIEQLVANADAMLYKAKEGGRDQSWHWTPAGGKRVNAVEILESATAS